MKRCDLKRKVGSILPYTIIGGLVLLFGNMIHKKNNPATTTLNDPLIPIAVVTVLGPLVVYSAASGICKGFYGGN